MAAPSISSSGGSQAAIDHAAALQAAEAARRRAEEAARRAAEEAQRIAAEARRLAAEARKKADDARKLAEAAEAKKNQNQAEQDAAAKLRAQAKTDELDALKKEATANLRTKEETLANSKLDDVRQRRAPNDPSEATRAAQTEVAAAQKTQALYEPPSGAKAADPPAPSAGTQALLDKAQKAAKPVFDAQARSRRPRSTPPSPNGSKPRSRTCAPPASRRRPKARTRPPPSTRRPPGSTRRSTRAASSTPSRWAPTSTRRRPA